MLQNIREYLKSFFHLIYPNLCIACNKRTTDINETFCLDCYTELPFTHHSDLKTNEFADHFKGKIGIRFATSLFYFVKTGVVQNIVKQLKYHGKDIYGIKLGQLFGSSFQNSELATSINIIVPVPLHIKKESKRGYNQSLKFAEGIGTRLNIPVSKGNLVRIKNTLTQTKMNNEARIKNMLNAFSVENTFEFENKHVLLVDDVLTTGSTLLECAVTLKDIPGITISMATIAMGETV
jgi:ComF family protein